MTTYEKGVWDQLKNKTIQEIESALKKDGWERKPTASAAIGYRLGKNFTFFYVEESLYILIYILRCVLFTYPEGINAKI